MNLPLAQSFRYCQGVARRRARNFYYAFRLLPPEKQSAICSIYAFMRYCDDISDEPGADGGKRILLDRWENALGDALQGRYGDSPILPAFHHTVETFKIPEEYFHSLIDGARMDLQVNRYATFQDLYTYCYRVASVVGLVCIHIFGFEDPNAIRHAEHVGIAFQLTNILRDIKEDADMGRIYLPVEDMKAYRCTEDSILSGEYTDRFRQMMEFQVVRAENFYKSAPLLLPLVHPASRGGLAAMVNLYREILNIIRLYNFDVFSQRAELSLREKIRVAGRGWLHYHLSGGLEPSKKS